MMNILDSYDVLHEWIMSQIAIPGLYQLGLMNYAEEADFATDWFLLGIVQIVIIACILRPLESSQMEVLDKNFHAKRRMLSDIIYTLAHRLGFFQLGFFLFFSGTVFEIGSWLHDLRFNRLNIENWIPGFTSLPVVSFFIYLVILDAVDYCYHRLSHRFQWWWQLHAVHHSQRYLTSWSDNRNHVLDDIMRAIVFALIALWIGVEPAQFLGIIVISRLLQSWQHGYFPKPLGLIEKFIVTPNFHRYHHAVDLGYELPGKPGVLGGCNFGVLFPWWDMILGTAVFDDSPHPTGVRGFDPPNSIVQQQWQSFTNCWNKIRVRKIRHE